MSDNIEFYYDRYFNDKGEQFLYAPIIEAKQKEASLVQQEHSYQGAIFGEATSINMVVLKRSISLGLKKPHPAQKEKFPPQTKLNFLRLDGVFGVTSSATNTTFETASFSSDDNAYDTLEMKANPSTLEVPAILFSQDAGSLEFYKRFGHTEDLQEFSSIVDAPFTFNKNTKPSRIRVKVEALKKLLPYKDFYPVTKTTQIGNSFKSFIYEFIEGTDENSTGGNSQPWSQDRKPGRLQAFLEPLFAPGVLYNSIKSGLAVSYPVYTQQPVYFAPIPFVSGGLIDQGAGTSPRFKLNYPDGIPHSDFRFSNRISSSFNYGGFYMMGACRAIPAILNSPPNFDIDFEYLYTPELLDIFYGGAFGLQDKSSRLFLTSDFLDLDVNTPTAQATEGSTGVITGQRQHHPGAAFINDSPNAVIQPTKIYSIENNSKKEMYKA